MRPSLAFAPFAVLALALLAGCNKQVKPKNLQWTGETLDERARPFREAASLNGQPVQPMVAPVDDGTPDEPAMVGVRHDLMLADGTHQATCTCLSVDVGPAGGAAFFWTAGVPDIGPGALALAIGARGVSCPNGPAVEADRRPSISAIDQINDDIVIEVEDLQPGRPLASGAIIPKPRGAGSIYVKPRSAKVLYGKGLSGGMCKVR